MERRRFLQKSLWWVFAAIGFLVIISASVLVWIFILSEDRETVEKSIAFLPLKYLIDDQSKQLQAYRVRDAITGHLSEIDCLKVRPTQSVDRFRDTNKSTQVIGEELAVSYLIRGIFFVDENQPKLSLQLINARDDEQMFHVGSNRM